jgi:hypothetical protein
MTSQAVAAAPTFETIGQPSGLDLVKQFQRCRLEGDHFQHAQHIEVAWHYLREWPLLEAIERFDRDLQRFATHHGDATKYHRTITWAFLFLIHERAERLSEVHEFQEFRDSAADLFEKWKAVLSSYYQPESLADPVARMTFVLPDQAWTGDSIKIRA